MSKRYTEKEKLTLIKRYLSSDKGKAEFTKESGICLQSLYTWMETYGIPDKIEEIPPEERVAMNKEAEIASLKAELAKVRKEKKALEKELEKERIRLMASEMLIDLTESTYHIKVRKKSAAK